MGAASPEVLARIWNTSRVGLNRLRSAGHLQSDRLRARLVARTLTSSASDQSFSRYAITAAQWTAGNTSIVGLGSEAGSERIILKFPHSAEGHAALQQQRNAQIALHADPRLTEWATLVPLPLFEGRALGQYVLGEQMLAGQSIDRQPDLSAEVWRIQASAIETISKLHRLTSSESIVGEELLDRWVTHRIRIIQAAIRHDGNRLQLDNAFARLERELRDTLRGRRVCTSWIHGDYWFGNVLVDRSANEVTGVIDWDRASSCDLALHDIIHMVLLTRKVLSNQWDEGLIAETLEGNQFWTSREHDWFVASQPALFKHLDGIRVAFLLYWLRHSANTLRGIPSLGRNRDYIQDNLKRVLVLV